MPARGWGGVERSRSARRGVLHGGISRMGRCADLGPYFDAVDGLPSPRLRAVGVRLLICLFLLAPLAYVDRPAVEHSPMR